MSQAKVEKYKEEKKNREKNLRRKRITTMIWVLILAALIGAGIGFPLGKYLYKKNYEKRLTNATIDNNFYYQWFDEYWVTSGYPESTGYASYDYATNSDADMATSTDVE